MTAKAARLLEEALRLPPKTRASLAGSLILSLDAGADPDAEGAWAEEIDRRMQTFEADKGKAVSWGEVKRSILKARRARKRP